MKNVSSPGEILAELYNNADKQHERERKGGERSRKQVRLSHQRIIGHEKKLKVPMDFKCHSIPCNVDDYSVIFPSNRKQKAQSFPLPNFKMRIK